MNFLMSTVTGQEAIDQKTLERPEVTEAKNTKTGKKTKPLKQN